MHEPSEAGASGGPTVAHGAHGADGGDAGNDGDGAAGGSAGAGAGGFDDPAVAVAGSAVGTGESAVAGAPVAEGPRPLGIELRVTGEPAVDALLQRLVDADHLAVPGHLEVYEDVHSGLRDTLTALDQAPGPQPPGAPHQSRS